MSELLLLLSLSLTHSPHYSDPRALARAKTSSSASSLSTASLARRKKERSAEDDEEEKEHPFTTAICGGGHP
jgi:hypothetical protein